MTKVYDDNRTPGQLYLTITPPLDNYPQAVVNLSVQVICVRIYRQMVFDGFQNTVNSLIDELNWAKDKKIDSSDKLSKLIVATKSACKYKMCSIVSYKI